ncbi:unannotated protein [freshwater metagenome]|uniref:Unannotated protein n=1 Tax=freshwater metagenome TaxID=449393 RepID=A0A6J7S055_9ZZZZ
MTCSAGLSINLSNYPSNVSVGKKPPVINSVSATIDGKDWPLPNTPNAPNDFGVAFGPYSTGQLTPQYGSHSATVTVKSTDSHDEYSFVRQLSIDCPAPVTNTVTVPGANTTTTVTVPGPTVTVSASPAPTVTAVPIAIVPAPATSPIAEPVPISLTPEAGTAPTSVNAGGGSSAPDSTLPLWAVALLATGALGAAGAGARLATSRKDSQE